MATSKLEGPGLFFVNSKITHPETLNEETFINWYSNEHIPEVLDTSIAHSAFRFKNADQKANRPYLVMYSMDDIGLTQSEVFKKINVYSNLLPGGGPIYDLADMDVRVYSFLDKYEPNGPVEPGKQKCPRTVWKGANYSRSNEVGSPWRI
jgi:hypothetical protein